MTPPLAVGVAATAAAGYYLNHKYQLSKDLFLMRAMLKAHRKFEDCLRKQNCSVYGLFEEQCQIRPFAVALSFEGTSYTWRDLELASNRMAHWFLSKGIGQGERVALLMHNSPMFIIGWLALLKIAAVSAFINTQIAGPGLIHSLKVANAKLLVFDYELAPAVQESLDEIKGLGYALYTVTPEQQLVRQLYSQMPQNTRHSIDIPSYFGHIEWEHLSTDGFPKSVRQCVQMNDPAALIYTSGTTGFPKAAIMDHGRCISLATSWSLLADIKPEDRVYVTLPLYHSAGSILGVGQSWGSGSTIVLARKFSVGNFWKDCVDYDVTHFQYIGELCRYLVNAPETPLDKKHKVRLVYGNGLRPDVWAKFQERFGIARVFEFYAMSEGTAGLINVAINKRDQGAVGFRGPIQRTLLPNFKLVKVDHDTEQLIRDKKTGFCIECAPGEVGELLTNADSKKPSTRYNGYFNQPKMTQAKLVNDVIVKGDVYFRTGDLLYNKDQYWYFADRGGDTYRWKGENVSTAEIADAMGRVDGVASCTVYGVTVPGQDGRAGMAALVLKDSIVQGAGDDGAVDEDALTDFLQRLGAHVAKYVPAYAVPRFLRICSCQLEMTGTFKNKKVELKKEGYDLEVVKDRIYWWTPQGRYERFGRAENERLHAGRARL